MGGRWSGGPRSREGRGDQEGREEGGEGKRSSHFHTGGLQGAHCAVRHQGPGSSERDVGRHDKKGMGVRTNPECPATETGRV